MVEEFEEVNLKVAADVHQYMTWHILYTVHTYCSTTVHTFTHDVHSYIHVCIQYPTTV